MVLTRRATLTLALSALATPALIRPGLAAQCRALDLVQGVKFTRQDGSKGRAWQESDGRVRIDYVTNRGAAFDLRRVKDGVFEVELVVELSEEPVVGASAPTYRWTFGRSTHVPEPGQGWSGTVRETREVTVSDENATVLRQKTRWTATYAFLEEREVKLSGCTYTTIGVEATSVGKGGTHSLRSVYFTDLGLALETDRDGAADGIVAMGPV